MRVTRWWGRETNINIPPFTRRYVLQKRDDLKFLGEQKPVEPAA